MLGTSKSRECESCRCPVCTFVLHCLLGLMLMHRYEGMLMLMLMIVMIVIVTVMILTLSRCGWHSAGLLMTIVMMMAVLIKTLTLARVRRTRCW